MPKPGRDDKGVKGISICDKFDKLCHFSSPIPKLHALRNLLLMFCQNSEHFTLKSVAKIMNEVNFNSLEKLFKLFSSDTVIDNLKIAN